MVHNGIEYGLMQAYAEGFDILRNVNSPAMPENRALRARPRRHRRGLAARQRVSSWLLDLTAIALAEDADLDEFTGQVDDSGEGRWTIQAAIEEAVPAEVLSAALYARFRSRQDHTFAEKMLSAMRKQVRRPRQEPPKRTEAMDARARTAAKARADQRGHRRRLARW